MSLVTEIPTLDPHRNIGSRIGSPRNRSLPMRTESRRDLADSDGPSRHMSIALYMNPFDLCFGSEKTWFWAPKTGVNQVRLVVTDVD